MRDWMKKGIVLAMCAGMCAGALSGCGNKEILEQQNTMKNAGIESMAQGDFAQAVEQFQDASELSTGKVDAQVVDLCFYKAEAQYRSGDAKGAMETYNDLINYEESANAYYLRGRLKLTQEIGDFEGAKKDFEGAIACDEKNFDLYIGIYNGYLAAGMEDQGKEFLAQALKVKDSDAKEQMKKGQIAYYLGEKEEAKKYLEKAVKTEPMANFYLGKIAKEEGNQEMAETYRQAFVDSNEATASELEQMGIDLMDEGNYAEAITWFQSALTMEEVPNRQSIMSHLVMAYEHNLDFASAKETMDEYLKLYPDDEDAQRESLFINTRVPQE